MVVLNARYASETTREDRSAKLEDLHLTDFVTQKVSEREALDLPVEEIDSLAPMAHQKHRTDRRKHNFLRGAVRGISWSQHISSQVNAKHFLYKDLMADRFSAKKNQRRSTAGQNRAQTTQKTQRASSADIAFCPSLSTSNVVEGP
eukprot:gb/GEZJ01001038.1/.p1 GENE.gb/GEZJ01001038.1/~~gb/GEZJ01001038.1/.p1  ORF type:complete len:146 (-),score=12.33 gb/GEZJ01001038.1/:396-833(-)